MTLIIACLMVLPSLIPQAMADGSGSYPAPETGDWTVNNTTVVTGETIILTGNLTIVEGGDLTLEACELRMNLSSDGGFGIYIEEGGTLRILNSTVINATPYHYKFEVYGRLVVYQSTIEELWGSASTPLGGIQIYSSAVTISYSTISKSMTSAIYSDGHYPVISYTTLNDSVYGLYLEDVAEPAIQSTDEFCGHVTFKNVTIPTGGGNVSSAYIDIPDQAIIVNASLNITGEYGQQEFQVFHTDFGASEVSSSDNVTIAGGDVTLHEGPNQYVNETSEADFNDGTHGQTQTTARSGGEVQLGFSGSVGPNQAPSYGTTTASSADPSYPANYAIDGNAGSKWRASSGSSPQWLNVDMGTGYNYGRAIKKVEFVATDVPNRPKDFTIQTAPHDDPNQWTTRTTVTGNTLSTWSTIYSTPIWARYVKISITNTQNGMPANPPAIHEFRIYLAGYYTSGNYTSGTIDAGGVVQWKTAAPAIWNPESGGATYLLKTKTSLDSTAWTDWSTVDAQTHGIDSPRGRYLAYALNFTASTDGIGSNVLAGICIEFKPVSIHQWEQSTEQDFNNGSRYGLETIPGGGLRLSSHDCQMVCENEFDYAGPWYPGELDAFSNAESVWNGSEGNIGAGSWDQFIVVNNGNGEYGIDQWIDQEIHTDGFLLPSNATLRFSRKFTTTSNGTAEVVPKAQLLKPDNSTATVWEGAAIYDSENSYTNLTFNITSFFNQSGTYKLRLFTTVSANLTQQSITLHNYWDDVYLNYTSLPPTGLFYSQILDAEVVAQWDSILGDTTPPGDWNVSLEVRTSDDNINWTNWTGCASNPIDFEIPVLPGRYFQYRAHFETSQWNVTPVLNSVLVNYSIYETAGYIISSTVTAPTNITYARISVNATLFNQSVYMHLSNDGGATWEEVIPGLNHYFEVEDNVLRYKVVLRTGNNSLTPILHDVTVHYSRYHYPTDISIDLGAFGDPQWNMSGEFSATVSLNDTTTYPSLIQVLQDYIDIYSAADNLSIPLRFYSSTGGKIRCSNLSINYYMPYINNDEFRNNDYGAYLLDCPDLKFIGCTFENLEYGMVGVNSGISIIDSAIWNTTTRSIWLSSASEAQATGTAFDRSRALTEDTSVLDVRRYLDLTALHDDGTAASGSPVLIKEFDTTAVFDGATDILGMIPRLILTEFVMTGSDIVYHTPHAAQIGSSNASILMDANRALTVYGDGDTDNDSIPDWDEDWDNVFGFDAGNHVYQREQFEVGYTNSGSRVSHKNGVQTIMDENLLEMEEGTYRLFVLADGNGTYPKLEIRVNDSDGNVLAGPDNHPVRELPDWYRTEEFILQDPTVIHLSLKDISPGSPSQKQVFVQRVMIVRVEDEFGNPQFPGDLFSDALTSDTDQDLLMDGCETKGEDYWFEAEDHGFGDTFVLQDGNASNSYAISRRDSSSEFVDSGSLNINPDGGTYRLAARCRANESVGPEALVRVRLIYNDQTLADDNYTLSVNFTWNLSDEFDLDHAEGQNIYILINDMDTQSRYSVFVDRILLTKTRKETGDPDGQCWSYNTNGQFGISSPEYNDGKVFVVTEQNPTTYTLRGVTANDGAPIWATQLADAQIVAGSLAVDNGTVYIGIDNSANSPPDPGGYLNAYYQTDGTLKWSLEVENPVTGTPTISGGQVFVMDSGGMFHVVNIVDGEEIRSMITNGSGITDGMAPVLDETSVYLVVLFSSYPRIMAFDRYSSTQFWMTPQLNSTVSGSPSLTGELLIVGQDNGYLDAYSAWTGMKVWTHSFGAPAEAIYTAVSEGTVVAATGSGALAAIWKDNGTLRWETGIEGSFAASPAIHGGEIFLASEDGTVYSYKLDTGAPIWSRAMGNNIYSSPIIADIDCDGFTEILVGSNDFNLYALNGGPKCYRDQAVWPVSRGSNERTGNLPLSEPVFPTSAVSSDTELDLLADGLETSWYFGQDRIEVEDYFYARNQTDNQSSVSLELKAKQSPSINESWMELSMTVPATGHYRISLSGTGMVKFMAADNALANALDDQYGFVLNAANISVQKNDSQIAIKPIYSNRTWHYIGTEGEYDYPEVSRFWFYQGEFDLVPGEYIIEIGVNQSPMDMIFPNNTNVTNLKITMDYIRCERRSADPICRDCDGDSVIDGAEVNNGAYLWNPDADEDGLSDVQEIVYGTNPEYRDTDLDGLRDRIELGLTGETDQYTIWDTSHSRASRFELEGRSRSCPPLLTGMLSNNDTDGGATTTNVTDGDTDSDGLPDGCVDGWSYNATLDEWGDYNGLLDNLHDFWEGEDLDLDGAVDSGEWNDGNGSGETNGSRWDSDTDGMPDGWESWYRINPLCATGEDGAGGNPDNMTVYNAPWDFLTMNGTNNTNDTLWNIEEYIVCTNPRVNDTDGDNATDFLEAAMVICRMDVTDGAWKFEAYANTNLANTNITYLDRRFVFSEERNWTEDMPIGSRWGGMALNMFIKFFDEQSFIMLNNTSNEVLVTKITPVGQSVGFHAYVYDFSGTTTYNYNRTYRHQEVYLTEPARANSDGILLGGRVDLISGIADGNETLWNNDSDGDGLVNARDIDSDNDWVQDPEEGGYGEWGTDLDGDTKTNMIDTDSDGDGLSETVEWPLKGTNIPRYKPGNNVSEGTGYSNPPYDPDCDDDGLLDGADLVVETSDYWYAFFRSLDHPIANITNGNGTITFKGETSQGTNWFDADSDRDRLIDGCNMSLAENAVYYGEFSIGTDPLDNDTDGDTLTDGDEAYGWTYYYEDLDGNRIHAYSSSDPRAGCLDSDADGLNDSVEYLFSNGLNNDTDSDGLTDGLEVSVGTSPLDQDSDDDYLPDGAMDLNFDGDRIDTGEFEDKDRDGNLNETGETDPGNADTDGDGVLDGLECRVIRFRTNALNSTYGKRTSGGDPFCYNRTDVWVVADVGKDSMRYFIYSGDIGSNPCGEADRLDFNTLDNYSIYYCGTYEHLVMDENGAYRNFTGTQGNATRAETVVHSTCAFWSREVGAQLSDPRLNDTDSDGLTDGQEILNMSRFWTRYISMMDPDGDGLFNAYEIDSDGDSITDSADLIKNESGTLVPYWWADPDLDGFPCALDNDSNNDNHTDDEYPPDPLGDPSTTDSDKDGVPDLYEGGGDPTSDIDRDGVPNSLDPDSDGDGLADGNNVSWNKNDPEADSWKDVHHISYWETETHRIFHGEGWDGTDPWKHDTDCDGLWDGFDPGAGGYTGWMRIGDNRFRLENGTLTGEYTYLGYDEVNFTQLGIVARGELGNGCDPKNADTNGNGYEDGEELLGYYLAFPLDLKNDRLNDSGTTVNPWNSHLNIQTGGWARFPLMLEEDGVNCLVSIQVMPCPITSARMNATVSNDSGTVVQYTRLLPNHSVWCTIHLGNLSAGDYSLNVSAAEGPASVRLCDRIQVLVQNGDPYCGCGDDGSDGWDSDGDMLSDNMERYWMTDPLCPDTDGDSLDDRAEVLVHHSNPLVKDSDSDGLWDGDEAAGWPTAVVNSIPSLRKIETAYMSGDYDEAGQYITSGWTFSDPTKPDTDNDGLDDYHERLCGTSCSVLDCDKDGRMDGWDSDLDLAGDGSDDEPGVVDYSGPTISYFYITKPANTLIFQAHFRIEDNENGIRWVRLIIDTEREVWVHDFPGLPKAAWGTKDFKFEKLSDYVLMPVVGIYSEDGLGGINFEDTRLGLGSIDRTVDWIISNIPFAEQKGGLSGFVYAIGESIAGSADLFQSLGSGENIKAIGKFGQYISKYGWGVFEQIRLGIVSIQERLNPYDPNTQPVLRERFAYWWYYGYCVGFVVWTALSMMAGNEFSVLIKALKPVVKIKAAVIKAVSKTVEEIEDMSRFMAKVGQYAKVVYNSKPGRAVIVLALYAGLSGALYLAFPEIFDNLASMMLGTMTIAGMFAPQAKSGVSKETMLKVGALRAKYPKFGKAIDSAMDKYLKTKQWVKEKWERFIDRIEETFDLDFNSASICSEITEEYTKKTGRMVFNDLDYLKGKHGNEMGRVFKRVTKIYGKDSHYILHDMMKADLAGSSIVRNTKFGAKTIEQIVTENSLTMEQFYVLKNVPLSALDEASAIKMNNIRDTIPNPGPDEWCQRIIKVSSFDKNRKQFRGFYTRLSDVQDISAPNQMLERLKLPGYENEIGIGQIRFKPTENTKSIIPTSNTYYERYPYTGSGFTGSVDGHTVPEYFKTNWDVPEGSEFWKMDSYGQWTHEFTFVNGYWS